MLKFDYNNMMKEYVGEYGFSADDLKAMKAQAKSAFLDVKNNRGLGMQGWCDLPYNQTEIVKDIIATAKDVRKKCDYFVVLGIGGSALGPMAVFQALCHLHHNELKRKDRKAPRFYVEDNVDPERMAALLDVVDLDKTIFNVITKSGSTSETMSQYLIIMSILKEKYGDKAKEHIIATTSENKGNLIKIAKEEGLKTFYIPDGVGGRFSELCPVGLLPAAVLGIDIKAMLKGAKAMDKACLSSDLNKNSALMAATLQYLAMQKGMNIGVVMPYADSLKLIADWYAQLWGESLGKKSDKDGKIVYAGQTPVKALGVTDQHSQIQLYAEGPFDKVITFIGVEKYRKTVEISAGCENIPSVNFLCGHTMNELITSEMLATEYAVTVAGKPNNMITLDEVNAFSLGELMWFFMLKTAYAGALLNIDTFNQPGVEAGKNATYALLGRAGYEEKAAELKNARQKTDAYVI